MGIPDYFKNEITAGLIRHEKTYDSKLGKAKITVFIPERFIVDNNYWMQFIPDDKLKPATILKDQNQYKYVGNEIINITYEAESKPEQRPDLRKLSTCPHHICLYCQQINQMRTQFENGLYRILKIGDYFSFSTYANLIQATLYVDYGKAQIVAYEGNLEFMKSDILKEQELSSVRTYGRKEFRTIKIFARPDESKKDKDDFARIYAIINRYNIENWP